MSSRGSTAKQRNTGAVPRRTVVAGAVRAGAGYFGAGYFGAGYVGAVGAAGMVGAALCLGWLGCTPAAPTADSGRQPVSSAMPTVVTATWKPGAAASASPSASASARPGGLDMKNPDDIRTLLLRQEQSVPHATCALLLGTDERKRTLADLIRDNHDEADQSAYHCDKVDSGYQCKVTFRGEEPEFWLQITFETNGDPMPQLALQTVRCKAAG